MKAPYGLGVLCCTINIWDLEITTNVVGQSMFYNQLHVKGKKKELQQIYCAVVQLAASGLHRRAFRGPALTKTASNRVHTIFQPDL